MKITATPVDDKDEEIDPDMPELGLVLEDDDDDGSDEDIEDTEDIVLEDEEIPDEEDGSDEGIEELDVDSL